MKGAPSPKQVPTRTEYARKLQSTLTYRIGQAAAVDVFLPFQDELW